jgi:MinD-like ATPase involved in chromosome partitioning or flagellar assembly|tara:strand:- start:1751 stop:2419 length:669 start_codon:yes stop_codon:yes gene_type:complete
MKITVYQAKGAAGKTPIATNIALDRDYAIGTNEAFHVYDTFIPDERLLALDLSESFPDIPDDIDIVFDLAGSISTHSHSITSAIQQSDLVIVPIYNEVKSLHGGIGTLREISKLGYIGNILVVATKLKKGKKEQFDKDWTQSNDFQNVMEAVKGAGFDADVLPLKLSAVFDVIFEKEKSIQQLRQADPLAAYTYRDIAAQFDDIYSYIDEVTHAKQEQSLSA